MSWRGAPDRRDISEIDEMPLPRCSASYASRARLGQHRADAGEGAAPGTRRADRTGVAFTPSTRDTYGFANDPDHRELGNVLGLLSRASASSARVFLGNYTTSMRSIWEGTRSQLSGMCERRRSPLPPDATCIPGREV